MSSSSPRTAATSRYGDADVASVAVLIADPARGRILMALADGRALPASVLATEAGISAQSASGHLKKLVTGNLLRVAATGRHRYYTLAGPEIAAALESLALIAEPYEITSLRQGTRANALRQGRTCYDHIAGKLGVSITEALLESRALVRTDGRADAGRADTDPLSAGTGDDCPYELGPRAHDVLDAIGVDIETARQSRSRRPLLRACVDWTEQRHHIAGTLGAEICRTFVDAEWITRKPRERAISLTPRGHRALEALLGLVNL
ncbi:winged helix-turn-helix domain-containing protein [Rhodococcus sp. IEGM 1381]|uniref:ArsR/SmtB family transcription factor n=1 Tax=Rhodococcus sp. IEGM 1381 TaxID=3047085 RepID=UPI0024B6ACE8|nr:winged helix-turn-helix domain-containing protein [Rhodococcus sp. IEGM 1381]MDI9896500.1 winged helix-turn-helix domain-containing protein [Rhodococcus sp. IEGM 1381]